ncbi:MAG: hypothetical protein M1835_000232 [Candelina submexicana]|nr:MAG: hypothetical protein M1835_000232 [Candelina submexicana]
MRRTLQTTQLGLGWLIERGVPVQPRGEWQENSDKPCDTGTKLDVLAREFPQLDFSTVFAEYPSKSGRWAFSQKAITQRGKDCLGWLKMRPEKIIIVTSHSGDGEDLVERELTEQRGGGMGKSMKGRAFVRPGDFPEDPVSTSDHEVVDEMPRQAYSPET